MDQRIKTLVRESVRGFRMPRYCEIPDVGLYLEQTAKYISDLLSPLSGVSITTSMISNYVKRGLISSPKKKLYNREQIAYLIFIAVVKTVLSMDDIHLVVRIQRKTYASEVAYNYFCLEFENVLEYIFGHKSTPEMIGVENTDEKIMLRNTIIAVAHKVYLDELFAAIQRTDVQ